MSEDIHLFITPPTLYLPIDGLRVSVIGIDDEWTDQFGDILEAALPSIPITFYHLDESTANEWQWLFHMMGHSNLVVVNLAKATEIDMYMVMPYVRENKIWFYVDEEDVDASVMALLNTFGANMFATADDLITILRSQIQ